MPKLRTSVTLATTAVIGLAMWAGASLNRTGGDMATAADRFLDALDADQKAKAGFAFDNPERLNWHFIPRERKGLPIKAMNPAQQALAFGLIQTGLAASGNVKATTIMSLESILRDMEKGSGPVRDPELYFISIFGEPTNSGRWGWRVEGHHLSLNFTLDGGQIVSATPSFFGSNPGEVRQGSRKGLRTLAEIEDGALKLLQALDADQRKAAIVADQAPRDIRSGDFKGEGGGLAAQPPSEAPKGIAASKLNDDQKKLLVGLVESYADDMIDSVGSAWMEDVRKAGVEKIHFAWSGPADLAQPHAYTVQGPTFLVEFNNTQNQANHIHAAWRNMLGDFGMKR